MDIPGRLTLYLDHYQFLVLLRTQEMVLKMLDDMEQDAIAIASCSDQSNHVPSKSPDKAEVRISVLASIQNVDVVLFVAPIPAAC